MKFKIFWVSIKMCWLYAMGLLQNWYKETKDQLNKIKAQWSLSSLHQVSIRCPSGVNPVSIQCPSGVCLVAIWCLFINKFWIILYPNIILLVWIFWIFSFDGKLWNCYKKAIQFLWKFPQLMIFLVCLDFKKVIYIWWY